MRDLDVLLRRLGEEAAPEQLYSLDRKVLDRISSHSFAQEPLRVRAGVVAVALLMGVAGGLLPDEGSGLNGRAAPLGEAVDLAPSTLLAGRR